MKRLHIAMALSLVFTIMMSLACFDAHCDIIRSSVLRLHILANSDSDRDQSVKLSVRDRILSECGELFEYTSDYDEAVKIAKRNVPALQKVAEDQLKKLGCDYGVRVEVGKSDFNTRDYGEVTLPAGTYTAVRVLLGKANGHNWWCVCFPNMCIPAASQTDEIGSVLDKEDTKIVTSHQKYKMRFKVVEWYDSIKEMLSK